MGNDGYSSPIVGMAGTLIRAAIRSINYLAGVSGWTINQDGSAEFSNVTMRGSVLVGTPGGQRVEIKVSGSTPRMELYSFDAAEVFPGIISNTDFNPGFPDLEIDSSDLGRGVARIQLISPKADGLLYGKIVLDGTNSTPAGVPATLIDVGNGTAMVLSNVHLAGLASANHAFQIGLATGLNTAFDNQTVMARNNGAAGDLYLNPNGGKVIVSDPSGAGQVTVGPQAGAHTLLNFNQLWALNGAAAADLFLNFSSAGTVWVGDGTAAGAGISSAKMHAVAGEGGNITKTTTSLTFVNIGSTATDVVIPYPPSGIVEVTVGAGLSMSVAGAPYGILSFEIRNGSAAGAILTGFGASDDAAQFVNGTGIIYSAERTFICTAIPVPASGNLFIRPMFRVSAAATLTAQRPYCIARPVL